MNFVGSINPVAHVVLEALINSLWQGVLLFITVVFILRVVRKLNATTRYIILWLTLLTLAFLPFVRLLLITGESIDLMPPSSKQAAVGKRSPVPLEQRSSLSSLDSGRLTASDGEESFLARLPHFKSINIPVPMKVLPSLILGLWILMTVFMLSRLLRSHFYTRRLKRDVLVLSPEYQQEITEFIRSTGIRRKVAIYATSNVRVPMSIGLFNPVILIPDNLMDELTEEQLKHVILHELAHIRRWDDWTNLIQRIVEAFYFWNPMILYIECQMRLEREIACDDWVIILSGEPKSYALCLTRLIEANMLKPGRIIATGATLHRKHVTTRIRMLLDKGCNTTAHFSRLGIMTTICVIMLAFAVFARISQVLVLTEPQKDDSRPSIQTEKVRLPVTVAMHYPKPYSPEKIEQRANDNIEDRISGRVGEQRIVGELPEMLEHSEISVSDPVALQNARLRLSEKLDQRAELRTTDGLPETLWGNSARTDLEMGEISQPNIAALIETVDNESEKARFDPANTPGNAVKSHKDDISTLKKICIEATNSWDSVKATSQKALESLDYNQERLYQKAAKTLAKAEEPAMNAKGSIQAVVDKLFSAIDK
jgi:beta-lactamase regulating signal transducer with metallopeptidase domain